MSPKTAGTPALADHDKRIALLEQSEHRDRRDFKEFKTDVKAELGSMREDIREGFQTLSTSICGMSEKNEVKHREIENKVTALTTKTGETSLKTKIIYGIGASLLLLIVGVIVKTVFGIG